MKNLLSKIIIAFFAFTIIAACNSDDNNNGGNSTDPASGRAVEYRLTTSASTILSVHYTNAEGDVVNVPGSFAGMTSWSKTVSINEGPFTAGFSFEAESPAGSSMNYIMQIFVDGELKEFKSEEVTGSTNRDISYQLM